MEMRLNVDEPTGRHLGALIAAMMHCGSITPDLLAVVVAPWATPASVATTGEHYEKWYNEAMVASNEAGFAGVSAADTIRMLAADLSEAKRSPFTDGASYAEMTTVELTTIIESLNKELYSRRVINPEDNPASGVAAAALNSDADLPMLMTQHGQIVTIGVGIDRADLASIFGAAKTFDDPTHQATYDKAKTDAESLASHPEISGTPEPKITDMVVTILDKNGLPWDPRIHAASKAINADGTWRQKRGVADALVTTVEAELRQAMSVPAPQGAAGATIEEINFPGALREGAPIIPPPPPVPAGDPTDLPTLVTFIAAQKVAGKLNQSQVQAALIAVGIEGALPVIAARPDLIPALVARLRAIGGV